MRFSRQEYWSRLPFPSPRGLPNPVIKLLDPASSPAFQTESLPLSCREVGSSLTCFGSWFLLKSLSSVQFSHSVVSHSLQSHESQHARPPNSQSLPKPMSTESVMPSSHLILCHPLLLLPIPPSIRVFSNESTLHMRWSNYWSFSFRISPSNEYPGLISFRMDWLDLLAVQGTQESSPKWQFKSINSLALSFLYSPTLTSIHDHWNNNSLN